ncbi:MAG: PD40 domain-containing protein [Bacteroidetes bacterium]|nr:PD40 domain-containing protein [Bacteroidota bacterium]
MDIEKKYMIPCFLALLAAGTMTFAQSIKGKAGKHVRIADIEMYDNNFQKALELYQRAYRIDTSNARASFKLGACMYQIRKYKRESLSYFEKAHRGGVEEACYYLANLYHLSGKYEDALQAFQDYKNSTGKKEFSNKEIDFLMNKCRTAIELVQVPVNVTLENIGGTINTEYSDYVPVISADESKLIFTSRRTGSTGGLFDPLGEYFEDVYISTKQDGDWISPKSISSHVNTSTHDACVGLSPDGELLFLYRTSEDLLSGDLYYSVFNGSDWIVPVKFPEPINTKEYTEPSASLTAEGQTLYFSSDRPGGYGKKDIYKVVKLPDGKWSRALNMGPLINTPEEEDAPYIHPDGKTLYFSSKGHKNMGGYDIFKTTFSSEGIWSVPENIGYPINTPDDDIYFVLSTNGKTGYYSSLRTGGYGGADIYLIHFPDEDFGLSVFKGMVTSGDSDYNPLPATITLFDAVTNKVEGIYNTNKLTGKFIMIVSQNNKYTMKVESEGYVSYTGKINQPVDEEVHEIKLSDAEK